MLHVYMEYWKAEISSHLEYILPVVFLAVIWVSVSVPDVLSNMPKDSFGHMASFVQTSVRNTEVLIQVCLSIFALSILYPTIKRAPRLFGIFSKLPHLAS